MQRLRRTLKALGVAMLVGCGPSLPPRFVLEEDLQEYGFRRYQKSLDVEISVPDNPATAHLATYVRGGTPIRVVPVSVTRYTQTDGLSEAIRETLRDMDGYRYGVVSRDRAHVWQLRGSAGDDWLAWTSGVSFVKIGVPEGQPGVPQAVLEAYLERYPSELDSRGRAQPK